MGITRSKILSPLLSFTIVLILSASCAGAADDIKQPVNREFGDWLITNLSGEPATLNPVTSVDAYASTIEALIYETLLKRDEKSLELRPVLAERWEIADDHLTYTFYLKKNIKWEDGHPFSGKDVVFSYERIMDPKVDSAHLRNYYQDIKKVELLDDYTVRFHYRIPYFRALEFCGGIPIVPAHVFKEDDNFNRHPISRRPVGTGPYKFLHWETGREIVLVRNEEYWGEKPGISRRVFKIITDPTVSLQVLKQGGLDLSSLRPIQWEKQTEGKRFKAHFDKYSYYSPSYSYIGWNTRRPPFDDKTVRQAMSMMVDRETILKKLLFGLGTLVNGPFYINSPEYNKDLRAYPYDPAGALALLKSAGWKLQDGVLQKDGKPFEFEFAISSGSKFPEQLGTMMKEDLKQIGIKMTIRQLEWAVFIQKIEEHNFDACTLSWAMGWESDPYQVWHSSMAVKKGSNFVGFKNEESDRLIEEARREFDPARRSLLYRRFQEIVHEEQPYTFLFTSKALVAVSKRFQNVEVYRMGLAPLYWWAPKHAWKYGD